MEEVGEKAVHADKTIVVSMLIVISMLISKLIVSMLIVISMSVISHHADDVYADKTIVECY